MSQGLKWSEFSFVTYDPGAGSANIDAINLADEATLETEELSFQDLVSREIVITAVENEAAGDPDGDVLLSLVRTGATGYQAAGDVVLPLRVLPFTGAAQTRHASVPILAEWQGSAKLRVLNDCGKQVAITIMSRFATWGDV